MKWFLVLALLSAASLTAMADVKGIIDFRAVSGDDTQGWLDEGLGKQRFDSEHDGLALGQAAIDIKGALADTLSGKLSFNAYSDREKSADITEAYVLWKPLLTNDYRVKIKVGAFFPTLSLENNGIGWTNPLMLSTSAINTWVGEELRTLGTEVSVSRPGQFNNSAHDFEIITSIFTANDPAGGLIAWRGWSVGDRVTGLTEKIPYPELPAVYGQYGIFSKQSETEQPFVEIDHHYGYYLGFNYGYNGWVNVRTLHYDNRANPRALYDEQYAWKTWFNHVAVKIEFDNDIFIQGQALQGNTKMGGIKRGVDADFNSWYFMASKAISQHHFSVRYDNFDMVDHDGIEGDDNSEKGHAIALNWMYLFDEHQSAGIEYLRILSKRPGREYLGYAINEAAGDFPITETATQLFYRFKF